MNQGHEFHDYHEYGTVNSEVLSLEEKPDIELPWFQCHRGDTPGLHTSNNENDDILDVGITGNDLKEGDEIGDTYKIEVHTGDKPGSDTDANCYIDICGRLGNSGERELTKSENMEQFRRNQVDTFTFKSLPLGDLYKIVLRHDGTNQSTDWFVSSVVITDSRNNIAVFLCKNWFSVARNDQKTKRTVYQQGNSMKETEGERYTVKVHTGEQSGIGEDTKCYINIFGIWGKSGEHKLAESDNALKFQSNQVDTFTVDSFNLGDLHKIQLRCDDFNEGTDWLVRSVTIIDTKNTETEFLWEERFSRSHGDKKIKRDLFPKGEIYTVKVLTGDKFGAETDAKCYIDIFGTLGTSGDRKLVESENVIKFKRNQVDTFTIRSLSLGELYKIILRHDGSNKATDWFVYSVIITDSRNTETIFQYEDWLSKTEDDENAKRILYCKDISATDIEQKVKRDETYEVRVHTADRFGAGIDAKCYIKIFGKDNISGEHELANSDNFDKFQPNQVDTFTVNSLKLGDLHKIVLRIEDPSAEHDWHICSVTIIDSENTKTIFVCERWFSTVEGDMKVKRAIYQRETPELLIHKAQKNSIESRQEGTNLNLRNESINITTKETSFTKYLIAIETGPREDMGTGAVAYIVLKGENENSKKLRLNFPKEKQRFVPGKMQEFEATHKDLGDLTGIVVGHTGVLPEDGWFISTVIVTVPTSGTQYYFTCRRWISRDRGDCKLEVDLIPTNVNKQIATLPRIVSADNKVGHVFPLTNRHPVFKTDEEMKLDMQQDAALDRMIMMSAVHRKNSGKEDYSYKRSISNLSNALWKFNLFKRKSAPAEAEIVHSPLPPKNGHPKHRNTQHTQSLYSRRPNHRKDPSKDRFMNVYNIHKLNQQKQARDMQLFIENEDPQNAIAKQFIEQNELVLTDTGELAYELNEEESELLRDCGNHKYVRRSNTEHNVLNVLNDTERTEFGSTIRRSDTICLPTTYNIPDVEMERFNEYVNYRKLCLLEKTGTPEIISPYKTYIMSAQEVVKAPKSECMLPSPPKTPRVSEDEDDICTPIQYQFAEQVIPGAVLADTETNPTHTFKQFTQPLSPVSRVSPISVSPISEVNEDDGDDDSDLDKDELGTVLQFHKKGILQNDDVSATSSRSSSFTPDSLSSENQPVRINQSTHVDKTPSPIRAQVLPVSLLRAQKVTYSQTTSPSNESQRAFQTVAPNEIVHADRSFILTPDPTPNVLTDSCFSATADETSVNTREEQLPPQINQSTRVQETYSPNKEVVQKIRDSNQIPSPNNIYQEAPQTASFPISQKEILHLSSSKLTPTDLESPLSDSCLSPITVEALIRRQRRVKKIELDKNSPYVNYDVDKDVAIQGVIDDVEATQDTFRTQDYKLYKKRQLKMTQKRKPEELNDLDTKRTDFVQKVYLGDRVDPKDRVYSPIASSTSSQTTLTTSADEDDFDPEKDEGLVNVLDKIRSLTNANVGELKSYKKPPSEVYTVVKCVFMILGEDLKKLDSWQECVKLLSKLGNKHVRNRVLRMRKSRITPGIRKNAKKILADWTSFDVARRSRVCVVFFIWCKEICDLNLRPQDNPLLPSVVGRFKQNRRSVITAKRVDEYNDRADALRGKIAREKLVSTGVNAFYRAKITGSRSQLLPPLTK